MDRFEVIQAQASSMTWSEIRSSNMPVVSERLSERHEASDVTDYTTFTDLERQFQDACDRAVEECASLDPPYHPTVWVNMSARLGAVRAAQRLVVSSETQTGFDRLVQAGRPDLTIEWAILDGHWDPLFSDQQREAARWRLGQAGVDVPGSESSR